MTSSVEAEFHERWLGLVQPTEGLVVSIPALVDAQCMARVSNDIVERFLAHCPADAEGERSISDLPTFFDRILGHAPSAFDAAAALPPELMLYVPEGRQTLRPTLALKRGGLAPEPGAADASPAARAAIPYLGLVWDLPEGLDLDAPETITGPWEYPPSAKFDRLLRECRVPIGILTNRRAIRLVYAPSGESSGSITFRITHAATTGGHPILDALVMLLGSHVFFTAGEKQSLPFILKDSRTRQANVTNELAEQVLDAIQILLRGFEQAAERDGSSILGEAVDREDDHVYGGLLTVLLRLVFVLYAEAWGLVPTESETWSRDYSVLALFEQLRVDQGANPDAMSRRFGAWGRLVSLFRTIYLGIDHHSRAGSLHMPPRRGNLFDPERYPFLEGWPPGGGAPIKDPAARTAVRVPSVDDETVLGVLERLVILQGQRLSYRNLDVEQLGSVYEGLMGYHVQRLAHDAVALKVKDKPSGARAWVEVAALLAVEPARRVAWLQDELGFDKASAKKVAEAIKATTDVDAACEAMLDTTRGRASIRGAGDKRLRYRASVGRLVLQPGPERRRTSSHYTPRSLSGPIVRRTLEPLLAVMGDAPSSERILNLKVCDPAMGSGAFLVEACRFLAGEVVKAWAREGVSVAGRPELRALRLVAQRCLYGVDKNAYAVELAKLSLWLVTLARDLPFTFLDHSLRHGDSLVGLDFDQIRAGHWKPGKQVEIAEVTLREALAEAIAIRQEIVELAADPSPAAQRLKEQKLGDADDALKHARLLADLVVGAFFAHDKDKDRERERKTRVDAFVTWKASGEADVPQQLIDWQRGLREGWPLATDVRAPHPMPAFHWMLEFPEVFYAERPDPLDGGQVNRAAYMDAFVGNPPFAGKNVLSESAGAEYLDWLRALHADAHGNADLCAHFFRRAQTLLGNHGAIGFIATNTIAQGDTRNTGLRHLIQHGALIYFAVSSAPWPGDAAVLVSIVHIALGSVAQLGVRTLNLDGVRVGHIDSQLLPHVEQNAPASLKANSEICFQGTVVLGMGFVLTPDERRALAAKDSANDARIFAYLGGDEVTTAPSWDTPSRYVINFAQMTLDESARWPDLLNIVRRLVKPERDSNARANYRDLWWQYGEYRPGLYSAIRGAERCLVTMRVKKHNTFTFVPANTVFANTLYVFALRGFTPFALLQSRLHDIWARRLSSTLEDRLNYSASDCFENYPFPGVEPRAIISALEDIGQRLYDIRAKYMLDEQVGLTITYNRLKDPSVTDERIVGLRHLHEEMDAVVLAAYGWSDIPVPPFCIATDADQKALDGFEGEVINRLFALNAERAEQERVLAAATPPPQPKKKPSTKRAKKPQDDPQGSLL